METGKVICTHCSKEFASKEALYHHTKSKHPEHARKSFSPATKKKIRNWTIVVVFLILIGWWIAASINNDKEENPPFLVEVGDVSHIPPGSVHWHPRLTILIDGKKQTIPTEIGVRIGRVVDTRLSEMGMSPTHTHESDGTIHLENLNPSSKPETTTLGYFFYVWNKQFNQNCIFTYCTDKGTLKMYVNGKESTAFENYLMKDKDDIKIEYTSQQ